MSVLIGSKLCACYRLFNRDSTLSKRVKLLRNIFRSPCMCVVCLVYVCIYADSILLKIFTASCLYRIAYFELEEFESAKASFQRAVEVRQLRDNSADMTKYLRQIRKCDVEIQFGNAAV